MLDVSQNKAVDSEFTTSNTESLLSFSESAQAVGTSMSVFSWPSYWTVKKRKDYRRCVVLLTAVIIILLLFHKLGRPVIFSLISSDIHAHNHDTHRTGACSARDQSHAASIKACSYDTRYPLTAPDYEDGVRYRISVVSDLDEERSKVPGKANQWRSFFKEGYLVHWKDGSFTVEWDDEPITLTSTISEKGRGLELSELSYFNGKLLTVDDRTGIVYQIRKRKVLPWVMLTDGDGSVAKGFKGEWMTVKDRTLYVGGLGKEWTTPTGEVVNFNPQYVKSIGPSGDVVHHNWRNVYLNIQKTLGIQPPGYVIHEAVCWSPIKRRWYFLPRRASNERYDDQLDERRGTNYLISCDERFNDFKATKIGKLIPTHGFSSFKFIPGFSDDVVVALKSEEDKGNINTYIMVFQLDGKVLMEEQKIGSEKFEGIEFV